MSRHKCTKFATVSGFRTVDVLSLLVSHLVTVSLTLIFKLLWHTGTRGVSMYGNNISDIAHFCSCFPILKQHLTFSSGALWPKRKLLPSCAATSQLISVLSVVVYLSDTCDFWSYVFLNKQ